MNNLEAKLELLESNFKNNPKLKIIIIGLGSVGNYLLTYLLTEYKNIEIYILGRSVTKMSSDINISVVSSLIRSNNSIMPKIIELDINNIEQMTDIFIGIKPDVIINTSRAYSHLKYGSISWTKIRAYGIWAPLSVKYIKNIMKAIQFSNLNPIVINASYPDVTNMWLKSANYLYPDFGSGNLNHLIPRIQLAIGKLYRIHDINNLQITLSTSHFHDVLISKEGTTDGIDPLINVTYNKKFLPIDTEKIYEECAIKMPSDEKRNMMNASSNYEIIFKIISCLKNNSYELLHIPGFCGNLGGYPVLVDFTLGSKNKIKIYTDHFSLEQMEIVNKKSIYCDGIESIKNGELIFTDEIVEKTQKAFNYKLKKVVNLVESDTVADDIISNIIEKIKK